MYIYIYTYTYIHTYIHTYTHTHTHIHTYTHTFDKTRQGLSAARPVLIRQHYLLVLLSIGKKILHSTLLFTTYIQKYHSAARPLFFYYLPHICKSTMVRRALF